MINRFEGDCRFLSNFYGACVTYRGIHYRNNEAAFQAQKTNDINVQKSFSILTPSFAKQRGRRLNLRPDWEEVKEDYMYEICKAKFEQNRNLGVRLLATGNEVLVEGNIWHDYEWGVCDGKGKNKLGKILMKVRDELRQEQSSSV